MANTSLASQYRPQTFAELVGQDTVKSILSRAAAEDRVAPAYLLSGTRGVGKTTIARIFAKALNCEHAPVGEPCNECSACRRITQGSFVDVVEIDAASNGGVDDVRKLRDAVGFSPIEGRYKVIIIDEAHMLSTSAFNALLKTLEEPPARVVFVLATTEPHKFPITILSRCQQFIFRQVPENIIEDHLADVLRQEGRSFEAGAVHLLARRAAGSVRDSMSLLGQSLAFIPDTTAPLTESLTREVLGLAGLEMIDQLLTALENQDVAALVSLVRELLAQGIDITFFLKEFAGIWRSLFLLKNSAQKILSLPPREVESLSLHAEHMTLTYIHAAWQLTLDSQMRIVRSLEPGSGLELLLLNLAFLPRLLPVEELAPASSAGATSAAASSSASFSAADQGRRTPPNFPDPSSEGKIPFSPKNVAADSAGTAGVASAPDSADSGFPTGASQRAFSKTSPRGVQNVTGTAAFSDNLRNPHAEGNQPIPESGQPVVEERFYQSIAPAETNSPAPLQPTAPAAKNSSQPSPSIASNVPLTKPSFQPSPTAKTVSNVQPVSSKTSSHQPPVPFVSPTASAAPALSEDARSSALSEDFFSDEEPDAELESSPMSSDDLDAMFSEQHAALPRETIDWEAFAGYCEEHGFPSEYLPYVRSCQVSLHGAVCTLEVSSPPALHELQANNQLPQLQTLLEEFVGKSLTLEFAISEFKRRTMQEMREELNANPFVAELCKNFEASVISCWDMTTKKTR